MDDTTESSTVAVATCLDRLTRRDLVLLRLQAGRRPAARRGRAPAPSTALVVPMPDAGQPLIPAQVPVTA